MAWRLEEQVAYSCAADYFPYIQSLLGSTLQFRPSHYWEGAIKKGQRSITTNSMTWRQYIAEATNLGHIASASYDFILSSHTLEHIANPLHALSEWVRVLKEKGLLVLVVPHREALRSPQTSDTVAHLVPRLRATNKPKRI